MLASPQARARLVYVALYAAIGAAAPYLVLFYREVGLDLATIGLVVSFGSVVSLAAGPLWGLLSDRTGGSPLVLGGAAACAILGALGLAAAGDVGGVFLAVILLSAGFGGLSPIVDARALEVSGPERSGFGPLRAWGSISYIAASFGTGAVIDRSGIGSIFAIMAGALLVTGLVGLTLRAPRPSVGTGPGAPAGGALAALGARGALRLLVFGPLGLFLGGAWLTFTGLQALMAFYSLRFAELGAPATIIGLSSAIGAAVEVPIMLNFAALTARLGLGRVVVLGAAIFAIRAFGAAVAAEPVMLVGLAGVGGIGYACFLIGGITYVARLAPAGYAATAQGVFSGLGIGLAQVVAGVGGGAVAGTAGIAGLFAACGALGLAAAAVVAGAIRRAARPLRSSGSPSTGAEAPPDRGPSPV